MQDDDETDEHDVERADEDMVDAGADLDVDEGTDDDNDSDGEGADEDVAEFAGLCVNMLTTLRLEGRKFPEIFRAKKRIYLKAWSDIGLHPRALGPN